MFSFSHFRFLLLFSALLSLFKVSLCDDIRQVNISVDGLVFSAATGKLYGGVTTGSNSNSIIPIDTATAIPGTAVSLGATPTEMVISSDGRYVDTVLSGGNQIRRFDTTTQTAGIQWSLGSDYSALYAEDIAALPGSPGSVVVTRANSGLSPHHKDIVIYDNGVLRTTTNSVGGANYIEINEAGTRLYGYFAEISSFDFIQCDINSSGLSNRTIIHPISGYNVNFKYGEGRAYGSNGVVFDPESGEIFGNFSSQSLQMTVPDAAHGRLFTASQNGSTLTILAQNIVTLAPIGSLTIPNVSGGAGRLLRWGTNGLVFRTSDQVFLVRSALVDGTPPILNAVNPNQAMWGASVVISGQNLLTTSSVKFNGLDATFRVNSDTQITATVPGNATSGPISVTTAGGSTNTSNFTVQPYVLPTLNVGDATVLEGNSGSRILSFPLTLSAPAGLPVSVTVATSNGTAMAANDYVSTSSVITIPAGQNSATATVFIAGDTTKEASETFFLNLSNPSNATLGDAQGVGTIQNDDFPTLSVSGGIATEGNSATSNLDFTVSLSYASDETVSFDFTTADGTALSGTDFVSQTGSRSFVPGQTTKVISVQVKGDTLDEADETVVLRLSNVVGAVPSGALARNPSNGHFYEAVNSNLNFDNAKSAAEARTYAGVAGHLATITSADEQVFVSNYFGGTTFWIGGIQAPGSVEPAGGFGWVTGEAFSYSNWNSGEPNNANANEEVIQQNNYNSWNDVSRTSIASRYLVEHDTLPSTPVPGGEAKGTILDDDVVSLSINDVSVSESATAATTANFTVSLSAASTQNVGVDFYTADGTAVAPGDYNAASNSLLFAPGETSKAIHVQVNNDVATESDETFKVLLSGPYNATLNDGEGVATILANTYFAPPENMSVFHPSGKSEGLSLAGAPLSLTATYVDRSGVERIQGAYLLAQTSVNGANALYGYYDAVNNKLYLQSDNGTTRIGGFAPGSDHVISNSQGSLNCKNTLVTRSGNTLSIAWNFTPSANFTGLKNLYLYVRDLSNSIDGWDDLGDWLIKGSSNAAPVNVSVTPGATASNVEVSKTLTAIYSDADGALDIQGAYLLARNNLSGANALFSFYDAATNKLYLQSDDGTQRLGGFVPGSDNVISNSQGTLNCRNTSVVRSGNTLTIGWNFTPSNAYSGLKNVYAYSRDYANVTDGWDDLGDWLIKGSSNAAPVNTSVTPSPTTSSAGIVKTLTAAYSDADGALDLKDAYFLVRNGLIGANSLWGYYDGTNNKLFLYANDGTTRLGGFAPGSNKSISNSQGTLNCQNTTVTRSGNTFFINWNFTPSASFTGTKNLYLFSRDSSNATDGWDNLGNWTIASGTAASKPSGSAPNS